MPEDAGSGEFDGTSVPSVEANTKVKRVEPFARFTRRPLIPELLYFGPLNSRLGGGQTIGKPALKIRVSPAPREGCGFLLSADHVAPREGWEGPGDDAAVSAAFVTHDWAVRFDLNLDSFGLASATSMESPLLRDEHRLVETFATQVDTFADLVDPSPDHVDTFGDFVYPSLGLVDTTERRVIGSEVTIDSVERGGGVDLHLGTKIARVIGN